MMEELLQVEPNKASLPMAPSSSSEQQNLKCPRCESTNTKFCYYNNYNLTQPRHFCKTCRRYWTKGGALRNVPIGGGCRKAKSIGGGAAISGRPTKAKFFSSSSASLFRSLDQEQHSTGQFLWPPNPNSHILSLLRPGICSTNPNSGRVKEDGPFSLSPLVPDASLLRNALNSRNLGFDYLSSHWIHSQSQDGGLLLGESAGVGIQDLYQRIRSNSLGEVAPASLISSSTPPVLASSSPSLSGTGVLEGSAMVGGEFGCWNSSFAWADLATTHGPFPQE